MLLSRLNYSHSRTGQRTGYLNSPAAKARRLDTRVKAIVLQIDNEENEMYSFD